LVERVDPNLPPLARYLYGHLHDYFDWNFNRDIDFNRDLNRDLNIDSIRLVEIIQGVVTLDAP
jgi:acyl carrier protein|tara:strand:+ start:1993 stop:2181 length:189 start_codon:yes stop_codon:yes gene_type:complete